MTYWKRVLRLIIYSYKWCWKHDEYKTASGLCLSCEMALLLPVQKRGTNPTPRKCRGHKIKPSIENGKCLTCGGVVDKLSI